MRQQVLIALGIMSLALGYEGVGLALECPKQPEQTGHTWEAEADAVAAKIGPVIGPGIKGKIKSDTLDLLGKLPDAGKIYLYQMMYATYCSSLRDNKTLSPDEKDERVRKYNVWLTEIIEPPTNKSKEPTGVPPTSQQPAKGNQSAAHHTYGNRIHPGKPLRDRARHGVERRFHFRRLV